MKVIGLTGGIATGKSTAAAFFRSMGVPVVDADAWAHRLLMPGGVNYDRVVKAFGCEILTADKRIDRRRLGRIVFADPQQRERLEKLTHPAIIAAIQKDLGELEKEKTPVAILDHPLLFETKMNKLVDEVWVVTASRETQKARMTVRDGLSDEAIEQRLAAQMPLEEKARRADRVLPNDQGIAEFKALLTRTWKEFQNATTNSAHGPRSKER